jgi:hypothetical protein
MDELRSVLLLQIVSKHPLNLDQRKYWKHYINSDIFPHVVNSQTTKELNSLIEQHVNNRLHINELAQFVSEE